MKKRPRARIDRTMKPSAKNADFGERMRLDSAANLKSMTSVTMIK
jgi:hypothetical protein